jgi:hypothetical protein
MPHTGPTTKQIHEQQLAQIAALTAALRESEAMSQRWMVRCSEATVALEAAEQKIAVIENRLALLEHTRSLDDELGGL